MKMYTKRKTVKAYVIRYYSREKNRSYFVASGTGNNPWLCNTLKHGRKVQVFLNSKEADTMIQQLKKHCHYECKRGNAQYKNGGFLYISKIWAYTIKSPFSDGYKSPLRPIKLTKPDPLDFINNL